MGESRNKGQEGSALAVFCDSFLISPVSCTSTGADTNMDHAENSVFWA